MQSVETSHIEIRKNRDGQDRAYIKGTRLRVQDIYFDSEFHGKSPDEIAADFPHVTLDQVRAALAYSSAHREAILEEIRQDEDFIQELRKKTGPGPLEQMLKAGDAVSPR
jgi:uncharacterized protein (DUF433 family)